MPMWEVIDDHVEGKPGFEARAKRVEDSVYVFVEGTDHWFDWVHHFVPGARRREIRAAEEIVARLLLSNCTRYVVGGLSMGGAIAQIVAAILARRGLMVRCTIYGSKRAPHGYTFPARAVQEVGDAVHLLPPWRPSYKITDRRGRLRWPWKAHVAYWDRIVKDGFA